MPNRTQLTPAAVRVVEMLAFPDVQMLDVTGPLQVFTSANDVVAAAGSIERPYAVRIVSKSGDGIRTSAGVAILTEPLPTHAQTCDTLIVAGGPGVDAASIDRDVLDWLAHRARTARRTASVCTGAFLLAACGALDHKRVTTHWSAASALAQRFPSLQVESDPIFLRDGTTWTSAGVTSGIDMALAMVEEDFGRSVSLAVARYLVVFLKRPGGQAQFSTALALQSSDDQFGVLHAWMNEHLANDLSLTVLAGEANMSERTFSRRYHEATRMTPARAVEHLRVDAARRLLTDSTMPLKRIAMRCGFGSVETLRRSFSRVLDVTPQDYRDRFSPSGSVPANRSG